MPNLQEAAQMTSSLERDKWEAEKVFRERELSIKEMELLLKKKDYAASHWRNPIVVAILAATLAAIGNAIVAYTNGAALRQLESLKSEQTRILEMIKTGDPNKASENLKFLLDAGLIKDSEIHKRLTNFLANRKNGSGPVLPPSSMAANSFELLQQTKGIMLKPYFDVNGSMEIGTGHFLTDDEIKSGKLLIDGETVDFQFGISKEQARRLLQNDLELVNKQIQELVKVNLTVFQRDALVSFVHSIIGITEFKSSQLLKKLNAGKFNEIPSEMMKYARSRPGYISAIEKQIDIWNGKTPKNY